MSAQLYPKAREKFLTAQINWVTDDFSAILLPEVYLPNFSNEFLSDVSSAVRIATSDLILNRTATNGYADCDPISYLALLDDRNAAQLIIYRDTGVEATSDLIAYYGADFLAGAPFPLEGLDYFVFVNQLEGGLFRL